jgi:hypothetical protein
LDTVDTIGAKMLVPEPIISPMTKYSSHTEFILNSNKEPIPQRIPQIINTIRGPVLSVSQPMAIAAIPPTTRDSAKAPEITVLLHFNSMAIGLKNIPYESGIL